MIYCVVDVDFYDHPKFHEVGHEGVGMWLFGLAYSRKHRLDGLVLRNAALGHMGDRRNPKIIKKLIDAGLWEEADEKYYRIINYAEKGNQTKAQIEEAQIRARERQQKAREKRASGAHRVAGPSPVAPSVTRDITVAADADVTCDETRESRVAPGCSTRSSISEDQQIGSESGSADAPPERDMPAPISFSEPLTDERREYARMLGLVDVEIVWGKFLGKYAEWGKKTASVDGSWRSFCANELPIQRRDRERARTAPASHGPLAVSPSRTVFDPSSQR